MINHRLQLGGLARLRDEECNVTAISDAEIAVDCLGQMEKSRGGASRGECGGDLAPDMPRLAEPRDDQLALGLEDQPAGAVEIVADKATGARFGGTLFVDSLSPEVPTYLKLLDAFASTVTAGLSGQ